MRSPPAITTLASIRLVETIHNGVIAHTPMRMRDALRGEWGVGDSPVLLMIARFAEQKGHRMLDDPAQLTTMGDTARERHRARFAADRMIADTRAVYAATQRPTQGIHVERTRVGFIGAGGIAHRHFGVLEQFDDVSIVAVADVDMARATDAASRFGARAFDDAAAMIDAVELDALFICVPPFAHGEPERLAINAGLPFFVEKPVALDLGTAEDVAASVERLGLVTAVGYHWPYLDTVDVVRVYGQSGHVDAPPSRGSTSPPPAPRC